MRALLLDVHNVSIISKRPYFWVELTLHKKHNLNRNCLELASVGLGVGTQQRPCFYSPLRGSSFSPLLGLPEQLQPVPPLCLRVMGRILLARAWNNSRLSTLGSAPTPSLLRRVCRSWGMLGQCQKSGCLVNKKKTLYITVRFPFITSLQITLWLMP